MKRTLLAEHDGLRTFVLVCETGDDAMKALTAFATEEHLGGSHFTAIGAFARAVVAYFDWPSKEYRKRSIDEQVEVLSLVGDVSIEKNISTKKNEPRVHAHVVLGKADATAHGGHLIEGIVRPTLEIIITEMPRHLLRRMDPESGLALIDPAAPSLTTRR
ncbi:MAG TPA: PPC domain-containing DNA-binding protein [Vicinamibacterales bacterium]|nr:PPC domain-containing DNA-binding protein [Vicinamibacterales bacterium]